MKPADTDYCPDCQQYNVLLVKGFGRRLCVRCLHEFTLQEVITAELLAREPGC